MSGPRAKEKLYRAPRRKPGDTSDVSYFEISKRHQEAQQAELIRKFGKSARLAQELADSAHALESRFSREIGSAFKTDCKSGCAFCCHQPATVFPFEAIRIAQILKESLSQEELKTLEQKMHDRVSGLKGSSVKQNINNKAPCPLLVNEKCSVYADRPLTCRLAHSFSVQRCRLAFENNRARTQIPISLELLTGVSGIIEGVFEQLPRKGLDGNLYELCSAVLKALATPEAAARWASGQSDVFGDCVRDDT